MTPRASLVVSTVAAGVTYWPGLAERRALSSIDLRVERGARIAVVGRSGAGKTTLLHLLAGLVQPTHGTVEWPDLGHPTLHPGAIAMVFQGSSLVPALTGLENVELALRIGGCAPTEARVRATEALRALGLDEVADRLPDDMSGGQAQRVAVARAVAGRARAFLADEPTEHLDRRNAERVVNALLHAADTNEAALVITTHDPAVAARMDHQLHLEDGRLRGHVSRRNRMVRG